jgi:hypothetical protein
MFASRISKACCPDEGVGLAPIRLQAKRSEPGQARIHRPEIMQLSLECKVLEIIAAAEVQVVGA